jgi:hypothetical protein
MDSSFRTELVKDACIADITDDLTFAVESGAANCTYQAFPATSPSNSSLVFSVQLPSESIVMGRDVLMRSALTFRVNCGGAANQVPVGNIAFQYGVDSSLAAFPFSALVTTASVQINNTNVSINLQDVLPQLMCLNSREHLSYYNGMTPSLPDGDYANFADALGATNNPVGAYANGGYDNRLTGRGGFPVTISVLHNITAGGQDASLISTNVLDTWVITVSAIVTEPLFLSPFIWGDPVKNAQGLVGVNNMAMTFNLDGQLKRIFSSASPYISTLEAGSLANPSLFTAVGFQQSIVPAPAIPTLLIKFLSTQASDIVKSKNVVPYTDFPRYITTSTTLCPPFLGVLPLVSPTIVQQTSQNLQLNQMPSKILVCLRKPMGSQTCKDSSTFLTITGISVNLNNASGLLSSASQADLWRMSARNGSNQTWSQFSGLATKVGSYAALANGIQTVGTGGSLLILNPAFDLSLPDYIAPGSLGNYNLQLTLFCVNQYGVPVTPEIVIVCVNDGILTTQSGVSSTYTGILTKEMVLSSKSMAATSSAVEKRMVGGRMLDGHRFRPSRFGSAMSGGAPSGGQSSGGKGKLARLMC